MKFLNSLLLVTSLTIYLPSIVFSQESLTSLQDQTSVAVTIYNENLALIKDRRKVILSEGEMQLAFRGVSARMRPETALLRSVSNPGGLSIIEQNFDFDLLTPQKLLEKYVNKDIRVARMNPATGEETIEHATVLSTQNGVVLKIDDRIEANVDGRFIFDSIPDNLRDKPTLSTLLINSTSIEQDIELSYLSGGLSWKADYVAELSENDDTLDLLGWVTLNNQSGTTYTQATMQLVAGDVNQVQPQKRRLQKNLEMTMMAATPMTDEMQEESLFEYHLYTLARPTSILNKQIKQVSLLSASAVPVNKEYLLQGQNYYYNNRYGEIGKKIKVGVFVQFDNEKEHDLGVPLPKGIVRVYKPDKKGNAQFVGEDRIDHTPNKESIRLKLGDAFDITADKTQTDFRHIKRQKNRTIVENAFEVKIKNAKTEPVVVTVREPIPGDWVMINETHKHKKIASGMAQWEIEVPAESSEILSYEVRVIY